MKRQELDILLRSEHYPDDSWSLDGHLPYSADDALLLEEEHGLWVISYLERGKRRREYSSPSEDDACAKFYSLMQVYINQ